jgi:hypothetical protein
VSLLLLLIRAVSSLSNTTLELKKKKKNSSWNKLNRRLKISLVTVRCITVWLSIVGCFNRTAFFNCFCLLFIYLFVDTVAIHHVNSASQSGRHNRRLAQRNRTSKSDQNANLKRLYHPRFVSQLWQFMLQTSASWQPGRWYHQYLGGTRCFQLWARVSHAGKTTDYTCIRKSCVTVKYHGGYAWQITSSAIFWVAAIYRYRPTLCITLNM